MELKYKRILLKLSGESLAGDDGQSFSMEKLEYFAGEVKELTLLGIETGIVIGGGNIFRGLSGSTKGIDRVRGDYMGMMATIMNSMALQDILNTMGVKSKILSGWAPAPVSEPMYGYKAIEYLSEGYVVFISGGTGNPFFTTDSAAALRAAEIKAELLIKGTRVDGVYSDDPEKNPNAKKFDTISYSKAYELGLKIMDLTAFTLCRDNKTSLMVLNATIKGNILKAVTGQNIGTLVTIE